MKIKYLGTAAFEGIPSLFCTCETCKKSLKAGGKNLRSRQQALINDDLLLDFNADTVWHSQKYGINFANVKSCLITHSHSDHLYPKDVAIAGKYFGNKPTPITFYAAQSGYDLLLPFVNEDNGNVSVKKVSSGEPFTLQNGKYKVLPLEGNHDPLSTPLVYEIECEGKKMLYLHDSGPLSDKAIEQLKECGKMDFISFDCTMALNGWYCKTHLNYEKAKEIFNEFKKLKIAGENTVKVVSHFSHNGLATHDEMCKVAEKDGFIVAFDGMEIEF